MNPARIAAAASVHLRVWLAERLADASGAENQAGAPWLVYYARMLGNKVGKGVDLHSAPPVTGMLKLGHRCSIEPEVDLSGHWIDGDHFHVGPITVGNDATIGARTTLLPGAVVGKDADVAPGSGVVGKVKNGQYWKGSPAVKSGKARHPWPDHRPRRAPLWVAVYGVTSILLGGLPLLALGVGLAVIGWAVRDAASLTDAIAPAALWTPAATLAAVVTYAAVTVVGVRVLSMWMPEGYHPVRSRVGWQMWATERLMDAARNYLFPVYASLLTPWWLRVLGRESRAGEPRFRRHCWCRSSPSSRTAHSSPTTPWWRPTNWAAAGSTSPRRRSASGHSSVTRASPSRAAESPTTAWSRCCRQRRTRPRRARRGWAAHRFGCAASPPRPTCCVPSTRPCGLKILRALVETCRLIPMIVTFAIGVAVLFTLQWLAVEVGWAWTALAGGVVLLLAGALAGGIAVIAKWLVVGHIRAIEHPLWSSFVWRNEVSDTFVETVAAPWFARAASGTPVMNLWLRALGAKIGRGVWCETYWLPEADLVTLEKGATVNRGCVVQTHLFHDRIMRMDTVVLEAGSTLGTHCVALPAARIGAGATVGPASLVMRGDEVPPSTRWQGNPIAPWNLFRKKRGDAPEPPPKKQKQAPRDEDQESGEESGASGHRPVPACQRKLRVSSVTLRAGPRIQSDDQPANRLGDHHGRHTRRVAHLHTGPVGRPVGDEGVSERQAPGPLSVVVRQAAHRAAGGIARGGGDDDLGALWRDAPTGPLTLGRSRFRGTDQRRARRGSAQRRRVVVSLRRPSQRQGQLPHPDQHGEPVLRAGEWRVAVPAGPGRHDDLDVRAGGADVDVFDHAADRRIRPSAAWPRTVSRCTPCCRTGCGATSSRTSPTSRR